jgi:hypothetical protein
MTKATWFASFLLLFSFCQNLHAFNPTQKPKPAATVTVDIDLEAHSIDRTLVWGLGRPLRPETIPDAKGTICESWLSQVIAKGDLIALTDVELLTKIRRQKKPKLEIAASHTPLCFDCVHVAFSLHALEETKAIYLKEGLSFKGMAGNTADIPNYPGYTNLELIVFKGGFLGLSETITIESSLKSFHSHLSDNGIAFYLSNSCDEICATRREAFSDALTDLARKIMTEVAAPEPAPSGLSKAAFDKLCASWSQHPDAYKMAEKLGLEAKLLVTNSMVGLALRKKVSAKDVRPAF